MAGYSDYFRQTSKSFAFFTNETYTISSAFDVTGGFRYTHEKKDATSNYVDTDGGAGCGSLLTSPGVGALNPASPEYQFLLGYGCSVVFNPFFAKLNDSQSLSENNVSGTIKLAYHMNDQVMTYISFADGYKAGGFNLARVTNPAAANPLRTGARHLVPRGNRRLLRTGDQEHARRQDRAPECGDLRSKI